MDIVLNVKSKADSSLLESKLAVNGTRVLVGRGPDCGVFLDGQGISREHLAVEVDGAAIFVTDLSSNGTWLNGKRLNQNGRAKVTDADLVELPGYELRFKSPQPTPAPAAPVIPASQPNAPSNKPPVPLLTAFDKMVIALAVACLGLLLAYLNY